ncbi:PspC domain-containing protein [Prevotella denticola]|uniref:PspC domain-containing protein n=1 Tax=Prevotella denticola TaxID=28129 RepID=UPI003C6E38F3
MYNKRLVRVTDNVWIAGVCAGVADYFGFDRDATPHCLAAAHAFYRRFPRTDSLYCLVAADAGVRWQVKEV